jgi:hypothetical protein
MACTVDVGGPPSPGLPIPASTQAAGDLAQTWSSALATAAKTGQVAVILNESQVSSFVAARFGAQDEPALQEPQVYLRQGQLQIYGVAQEGPLRAHFLVTVVPVVKQDGGITFDVASADFGPLPAPQALRDSLSAVLTEAFTGTIGSFATGIRIRSLAIADGEMAIVGELR